MAWVDYSMVLQERKYNQGVFYASIQICAIWCGSSVDKEYGVDHECCKKKILRVRDIVCFENTAINATTFFLQEK